MKIICLCNRVFRKHTQLAILELLSPLSSNISVVYFYLHHTVLVNVKLDVSVNENNIARLHTSLAFLNYNATAKKKLAILAFVRMVCEKL